MIKMLFIVGSLKRGGAETFAMKLFRASLARDDIVIDFLSSLPGVHDEEVRSNGRSVFYTGLRTHSPLSVFRAIRSVVRYGRYDFVLKFSDSSLSFLDLIAARRGRAKVTGARSMNSKATGSSLLGVCHYLLRPMLRLSADLWIAPSREAGAFMFGERKLSFPRYLALPNALPLGDYSYAEEGRELLRVRLGIGKEEFLIGFLGRLTEQKNPLFLIRAFSKLLALKPNARLVILGEGPLRAPMEKLAKELRVERDTFFLEPTDNVRAVYSALDALWLPSFFEGMPNVVIEGQASGLPCLVSENVTKEVALTGLVHHLPLEEGRWAKETAAIATEVRSRVSTLACDELQRKGYEISNCLETVLSKIKAQLKKDRKT